MIQLRPERVGDGRLVAGHGQVDICEKGNTERIVHA